MIRSSRTGFAVRWLAALSLIAGPLCLAVQAAPPAPPPGLIYFKKLPSWTWSMKGDGSSAGEALPPQAMNALEEPGMGHHAIPCSHLYGGHRWFITTAVTGYYDSITTSTGGTLTDYPHRDLVAVRRRPGSTTEIDVIQLTDFYGIVNLRTASAIVSNDSNESLETSFVGGWANDIRNSFVEADGATYYDASQSASITLRLPLRVSDFLDPGFVQFDGTLTDEDIDDLLWPTINPVHMQGTTSPDGSLTVTSRPSNATSTTRLMIVDAAAPDYDNPVLLLWDGSVTSPISPGTPKWSPDGSTIAFHADSGSNVWTIPAAGGAPKKVMASATVTTKNKGVTTTATYKYTNPIWSADSKYVVAVRSGYSTSNEVVSTHLVRVPAAGGAIVELAPVTLGTTSAALRWVPSN